MLPESGRWRMNVTRRIRELDRNAGYFHGAGFGVFQRHHHIAGEHLGRLADFSHGHSSFVFFDPVMRTMRRLNIKFLVCLVVGALLLSAGAFASTTASPRANQAEGEAVSYLELIQRHAVRHAPAPVVTGEIRVLNGAESTRTSWVRPGCSRRSRGSAGSARFAARSTATRDRAPRPDPRLGSQRPRSPARVIRRRART